MVRTVSPASSVQIWMIWLTSPCFSKVILNRLFSEQIQMLPVRLRKIRCAGRLQNESSLFSALGTCTSCMVWISSMSIPVSLAAHMRPKSSSHSLETKLLRSLARAVPMLKEVNS